MSALDLSMTVTMLCGAGHNRYKKQCTHCTKCHLLCRPVAMSTEVYEVLGAGTRKGWMKLACSSGPTLVIQLASSEGQPEEGNFPEGFV